MLPWLVLQEDGFSLEFRVMSDLGAVAESSLLAESVGNNAYVLQERIIVPPHLAGKAAGFSARTVAPSRCNDPLILIGHPDLPVQYSSIIARTEKGKARVEKCDAAIRIIAEGMSLLFSAAIFCASARTEHSFSSAFNRISEVLIACHMREAAIARTWLFMEDILRDYDMLNKAREKFFTKWFSSAKHFIPASTGIHGRILGNQVLSIEFCAFSGERLSIRQPDSPLQNEPTDYGKLFSRVVVVQFPNNKLVFISGTASIDRNGASVHTGNFERQMAFVLEVVSAILREVDGKSSNVMQAAVYLKRSTDINACIRILDEAEFPRARTLFHLDVDLCRDNLLCEIEATAVIPR